MKQKFQLLPPAEGALRVAKVQEQMRAAGMGAMLVSDNVNLLYLAGRVYAGYAWIPAEGEPVWFVRRPVELEGDGVAYIRKPEDIPALLSERGMPTAATVGLEFDQASHSLVMRLGALFPASEIVDASASLRRARAVKTPYEVELMRRSGVMHTEVYRHIAPLYQQGMTDLELQIEAERVARLHGCLGLFRVAGQSMEIFMGNVISGDNADVPTPYDFAMGGAGADPSLPVGADGKEIRPGTTVMMDLNGNFTGYMTDMTRTYYLGDIPAPAREAHQCSIDICRMFEREALPGVEAKLLYERALAMVRERGLDAYFMGHRQHAGFIGHGVGMEINELPVIAPRSRDLIAVGNVIALEPKFVIPHVGAVGVENTYAITPAGPQLLTTAPEELLPLG